MNSAPILAHIARHIQLTDHEQLQFLHMLEERTIRRGEWILRQADPCSYLSFINEGVLRAYFLNSAGKESTIMIAMEGWWITDMYSYLNELPAMVHIQALEKCSVLQLSKKNLDRLFEEIPAFNQFFRILMQNAYCREQLRMIQNLSLPALDRYEHFVKKYPQIVSRVPMKYIASYLGVTPEFLSTIRAQRN